jgi:hypothetical protein
LVEYLNESLREPPTCEHLVDFEDAAAALCQVGKLLVVAVQVEMDGPVEEVEGVEPDVGLHRVLCCAGL